MAAKKGKADSPSPPGASRCKFYEAALAADSSGNVIKSLEIDKQEAINLRKNGYDVVVCGPDPKENRREASNIEQAASGIGNIILHPAHASAGTHSLNHYQAINPPPTGHCFYETKGQKAK
jgi:hypothetical protein